MKRISIDGGATYVEPTVALEVVSLNDLIDHMDEKLCFDVIEELAPCEREDVLVRYLELAAADVVIQAEKINVSFMENGFDFRPEHATALRIEELLDEVGGQGEDELKAIGEMDAIYAIKKYSRNGTLYQVDFHRPPICLEHRQFKKLVRELKGEHPGCKIYAFHKKKGDEYGRYEYKVF